MLGNCPPYISYQYLVHQLRRRTGLLDKIYSLKLVLLLDWVNICQSHMVCNSLSWLDLWKSHTMFLLHIHCLLYKTWRLLRVLQLLPYIPQYHSFLVVNQLYNRKIQQDKACIQKYQSHLFSLKIFLARTLCNRLTMY